STNWFSRTETDDPARYMLSTSIAVEATGSVESGPKKANMTSPMLSSFSGNSTVAILLSLSGGTGVESTHGLSINRQHIAQEYTIKHSQLTSSTAPLDPE